MRFWHVKQKFIGPGCRRRPQVSESTELLDYQSVNHARPKSRPASSLERVPMVTRLVFSFVIAKRAGNGVGGVQRTFALRQIAEEVKSGLAVRAGHYYVPGAGLWLDGHGELLPVGAWDFGAGGKPEWSAQFFKLSTNARPFHLQKEYKHRVCTLTHPIVRRLAHIMIISQP